MQSRSCPPPTLVLAYTHSKHYQPREEQTWAEHSLQPCSIPGSKLPGSDTCSSQRQTWARKTYPASHEIWEVQSHIVSLLYNLAPPLLLQIPTLHRYNISTNCKKWSQYGYKWIYYSWGGGGWAEKVKAVTKSSAPAKGPTAIITFQCQLQTILLWLPADRGAPPAQPHQHSVDC